MSAQVIQVPVSLLLCQDLPASAKVVWMASRLRLPAEPAGTGWLSAVTGLSRPTVLSGKARLLALEWDPTGPGAPARTVPIPVALVTNSNLRAQSRVLYGVLLLIPSFCHPGGHFTYEELARLAQVSPKTTARAVDELVRAEWIKVERTNRLARIHYELTFPGFARGLTAMAKAQHRLEKARHYGEALMREYLSLLVDSEQYEDNATPGFLVNPRTLEHLQLDRFYPPSVAFEFNGPQHYRATARYSASEVAGQRERDYIKLGICVSRGISLVIIHPEDLSLAGMQRHVGNLLPRRNLTGYELLVDYLEAESRSYRRSVASL
ncbi:MAG: ArsR family transcriptional regulator [Bacillota bacterium]